MINGLNIYYSKNIGCFSKTASGLKPVSSKQKANGLKPITVVSHIYTYDRRKIS